MRMIIMMTMTSTKTNLKKCRKSASLLTLLLVCMLCFAGCGNSNKASGLFDDLEWGSDRDTVLQTIQNKEGVTASDSIDGTRLVASVENYLSVEGVTGRIECSFEEDVLDEVFIYLEFDETAYTNEEIMEQYAEKLTESFGEPDSDSDDAKVWEMKESEVHLANFSYGVLVIDYMSVD